MRALITPAIQIKDRVSGPVYFAVWRDETALQIWRRVGPAWVERDASGQWRKRAGRTPDGFYDERRANVKAAELVKQHESLASDARERRTRGVSFREVALAYLAWLEQVIGAKPSTLRQHRSYLAEPDVRYLRGRKKTNGYIMKALGDRPCARIETIEIDALLDSIARTGVAPRTVNGHREIVCAVFNFGMKSSRFKLAQNPAAHSQRRRLRPPGPLIFYTPDEIEALARSLSDGQHRDVHERHTRACGNGKGRPCSCVPSYRARGAVFETLMEARTHHRQARTEQELAEDRQDAEAVRVAAYAGLRQGELRELRWSDVDWSASVLTISRALSDDIQESTKSGYVRQVPLADQAGAALERLSHRDHYTAQDDLVFVNALGRHIDDSALRRRFKRARDAAGLRPLRWHDLRHTFGSLLVAKGIDLVSIQDAMGHAQLTTTSRYLHARPAHERAAAFTAAFTSARPAASIAQSSPKAYRDGQRHR